MADEAYVIHADVAERFVVEEMLIPNWAEDKVFVNNLKVKRMKYLERLR
jgi:hypothetical protein